MALFVIQIYFSHTKKRNRFMIMHFGRKTFDKEILQALDSYQARIIFDKQGNIIEANANFLNTLGYSTRQLVIWN